jgi:hypothetical protein
VSANIVFGDEKKFRSNENVNRIFVRPWQNVKNSPRVVPSIVSPTLPLHLTLVIILNRASK